MAARITRTLSRLRNYLQFTLRNLLHFTAALSVALAAELSAGLFTRIGSLIPYEATIAIGPICVLAAIVIFFLPAPASKATSSVDKSGQIDSWIVIYFALISLVLAVSLLLQHESGGRFSGMANAISLVTTTTLETILAATTLFVLRIRRAGSGAMRLVFGILLCCLIPVVFAIAMG